jgi:hypothetical protein
MSVAEQSDYTGQSRDIDLNTLCRHLFGLNTEYTELVQRLRNEDEGAVMGVSKLTSIVESGLALLRF